MPDQPSSNELLTSRNATTDKERHDARVEDLADRIHDRVVELAPAGEPSVEAAMATDLFASFMANGDHKFLIANDYSQPEIFAALREIGLIDDVQLKSRMAGKSVYEDNDEEAVELSAGKGETFLLYGIALAIDAKLTGVTSSNLVVSIAASGSISTTALRRAIETAAHFRLKNWLLVLDSRKAKNEPAESTPMFEVAQTVSKPYDVRVIDAESAVDVRHAFDPAKNEKESHPLVVVLGPMNTAVPRHSELRVKANVLPSAQSSATPREIASVAGRKRK